MSEKTSAFRPGRRFTKRMLVANNVAAWCASFLALYLGEGVVGIVIPAIGTYLFALFSAYVGIGHLDIHTGRFRMKIALLVAATILLTLAVDRAGHAAYSYMQKIDEITSLCADRDLQGRISGGFYSQLLTCKSTAE